MGTKLQSLTKISRLADFRQVIFDDGIEFLHFIPIPAVMLAAADSLELVFCASTVTAAVGAGWCITSTTAPVKLPPQPPVNLPMPSLLAVAWA